MKHYVSFLLFLLVALSACQSADPGPAAVPETAAVQVENWSGAAATVSAQVYGDDSSAAVVATGTVDETGRLEFVLAEVQTAQRGNFAACPGVTVSKPGLKLGSFSALEVVRDSVSAGRISHTASLEVMTSGLQQAGDYYLQYTYADRDADVSGRCQGGAPAVFGYALTLNKGWNQVVFRLLEDGGLELSTEPVPQGAAWFFSEAGQ